MDASRGLAGVLPHCPMTWSGHGMGGMPGRAVDQQGKPTARAAVPPRLLPADAGARGSDSTQSPPVVAMAPREPTSQTKHADDPDAESFFGSPSGTEFDKNI